MQQLWHDPGLSWCNESKNGFNKVNMDRKMNKVRYGTRKTKKMSHPNAWYVRLLLQIHESKTSVADKVENHTKNWMECAQHGNEKCPK